MNSKGKTLAVLFFLLASPTSQHVAAQPQTATTPEPTIVPSATGKSNRYKNLDALLVQLSALTKDLLKFVADSDCNEHFSMANLATRPIPVAAASDVEQYFECRALTERNFHTCSVLDSYNFVSSQTNLSRNCQVVSLSMATARARVSHSPAAMALCLEAAEHRGKDAHGSLAADAKRFCSVILGPGDSASVCAALSPGGRAPDAGSERCLFLSATRGDDEGCAKTAIGKVDDRTMRICNAVKVYSKAQTSHNPAACGGSLLCRAMMDEPGICGRYEAKLKQSYCRAEPKIDPELLRQKQAGIDALVSQLNGALNGFEPKNTQSFKTRKDLFAERRNAVQALLKKLGKGEKVAAPRAPQATQDSDR